MMMAPLTLLTLYGLLQMMLLMVTLIEILQGDLDWVNVRDVRCPIRILRDVDRCTRKT